MPVQSVRLQRGNSFEESVFAQVGTALKNDPEAYTIASAFYLDGGRQYDGLLISPKAVFTLEMKNVGGSVQMGPNTPLEFFDKDGRIINAFQNRHESALEQADLQWKKLSDYFKEKYGTDSIFVQSVLVFPDGTRLDVPQVNRDFSNYHANALFATVSELPRLVQAFRPPYPLSLDPKAQEILVRGLRDGVNKLSTAEKVYINNLMPPKRPSSPTPKPSPTPAPLRTSYDIARQRSKRPSSPRHEPETPINIPPPPDPPQRRAWPSWLWLPLGFAAVYFLLGFITTATVALVGAAILTFLLWIGRRKLASVTAVALFGGILLVNSINFANILSAARATIGEITEAANPTQPAFEGEAIDAVDPPTNPVIQQKEGSDAGIETAVPPTPRLRVNLNSNVRSEPSMEGSIIGTAEADTVFVILDQTADFSWYKIRLSNGTEGWIGSTRIERLSP